MLLAHLRIVFLGWRRREVESHPGCLWWSWPPSGSATPSPPCDPRTPRSAEPWSRQNHGRWCSSSAAEPVERRTLISKVKSQYLLTLQVSRYCLFALQSTKFKIQYLLTLRVSRYFWLCRAVDSAAVTRTRVGPALVWLFALLCQITYWYTRWTLVNVDPDLRHLICRD